jgi:hypothetical protein
MFTWNNYTEDTIKHLKELEGVTRLVFGKEIAPSTGTPHLQGVLTFRKQKTLKQVCGTPDAPLWGAHCEVPKYFNAVVKYCKKDGDFFEKVDAKQGKRTDLALAAADVAAGKSMLYIAEKYPTQYIMYNQGIQKLQSTLNKPRTNNSEPPSVHWFWGDTGTGKSRYVMHYEVLGGSGEVDRVYIHNGPFKFFNGYENQDVVLFDDFREGFVLWGELLSLLDRYPRQVEIKGGWKHWNPKRIYITSAVAPGAMYAHEEEDKEQLLRRLTSISHFTRGSNGDTIITTDKGTFPFPIGFGSETGEQSSVIPDESLTGNDRL